MEGTFAINDAFILVAGTLSMVLMATMVIVFAFFFQRKLIRKEQAFRAIEQQLKKLELDSAYRIIEAQEQERKKIAQDLHDNMGSVLAIARMQAALIPKNEQVLELIDTAISESRRISHTLDTITLSHFGLDSAIQQLVEYVSSSRTLVIDSFINVAEGLSPSVSLQVYRIVQELVSNTLKHANAARIKIEINAFHNEWLNIIFEDNGKGFDRIKIQPGMGLKNIQSRVAILNGSLEIESTEGKGTSIVIEIPIKTS
jgi:two-component system NarL family sensor kinase